MQNNCKSSELHAQDVLAEYLVHPGRNAQNRTGPQPKPALSPANLGPHDCVLLLARPAARLRPYLAHLIERLGYPLIRALRHPHEIPASVDEPSRPPTGLLQTVGLLLDAASHVVVDGHWPALEGILNLGESWLDRGDNDLLTPLGELGGAVETGLVYRVLGALVGLEGVERLSLRRIALDFDIVHEGAHLELFLADGDVIYCGGLFGW